MIVSEKLHQNISEYIQFLFRNIFKFNKNEIISRNFKNFKREKLNPSYKYKVLVSAFGK